jgi:hypothetical protein
VLALGFKICRELRPADRLATVCHVRTEYLRHADGIGFSFGERWKRDAADEQRQKEVPELRGDAHHKLYTRVRHSKNARYLVAQVQCVNQSP